MTDEKKLKIEFAPGAFDTFEGTQEELDALIAEVQHMFDSMTPEELEANSREVTDLDLEDLPDDVKENIARFATNTQRKLQ